MIELTAFHKQGGPLTKRISLAADESLHSDGSACVMTSGTAHRLPLKSLEEFASFIRGMGEDSAIALGALRKDVPDPAQVVTAGRLPRAGARSIARTTEHLSFRSGQPALALLDIDVKGLPVQTAELIDELGGLWAAITSVIPKLAGAATLRRASTSAGLRREDTNAIVPGSQGLHIYVLVKDGEDIPRFLRTMHDHLWLAGLGWFTIGSAGQTLDRSLVDRSVGSPERLVFEAPPILASPLVQDQAARAPEVISGDIINTRSACPELSLAEKARLSEIQEKARDRLSPKARSVRQTYMARRTDELVQRTGCTLSAATRIVKRQLDGVLRPDVELHFDDPELQGLTVADVLKDPTRFTGEALADPLEGPAYGRGKAKTLARADGSLWIHSFAHGRTTYDLKHDAKSLQAIIEDAPSGNVARVYVEAKASADVDDQECQQLDALVSKKEGVGLAPLRRMAESEAAHRWRERVREDKARRLAARTDRRPRLPAPEPDEERLPILRSIDEILVACNDPEPPMRDLDGHPVQIQDRASSTLHELTAAGANGQEEGGTRLPSPTFPLITPHDRYTLGHEIERHIEFFSETAKGDVSVALPQVFVDHYAPYRSSEVPIVQSVGATPLVMRNGQLIRKNGLHKGLELVLRIAPEMQAYVPDPRDCTLAAAAKALRFLFDVWLVDVHTTPEGKSVLVALALSVLERALLPERPVFIVSAPRRGGGKTTVLSMISTLVTGKACSCRRLVDK